MGCEGRSPGGIEGLYRLVQFTRSVRRACG